ncbi:MAG: hypothetical protein GY873_29710 [Bosea sp.]|uniref:hypothetical protein n=1 Tax=Bosea sp. (in: a-proteobacteria) TaxID=1871050 RepID=UPI002393A05D|nr:hypothetical protein [Bosea sp. (in: a-proteobacteria)]MCP4738372.1 hypothetical protein [Bosea sp. (in: a-proteobacteria)]
MAIGEAGMIGRAPLAAQRSAGRRRAAFLLRDAKPKAAEKSRVPLLRQAEQGEADPG